MEPFDIALFFQPDLTLVEVAKITEELYEKGIYLHYNNLVFTADGMTVDAHTYDESAERTIESMEGVEMDWDMMNDWLGDMDQEEEE